MDVYYSCKDVVLRSLRRRSDSLAGGQEAEEEARRRLGGGGSEVTGAATTAVTKGAESHWGLTVGMFRNSAPLWKEEHMAVRVGGGGEEGRSGHRHEENMKNSAPRWTTLGFCAD